MFAWVAPRLPAAVGRAGFAASSSSALPRAGAAAPRALWLAAAAASASPAARARGLSTAAADGASAAAAGDAAPAASTAAAAAAAGAGGAPRRRALGSPRPRAGARECDVIDLRRPVGTAAVKVARPPKSVARYAESLRARVERVAAGLAAQDKKRADYKKTLPAKGVRKGILQYIKKAAWEKD